MFSVSSLPAVNATLNAVSALLLISGYFAIRRGQRGTHRALMLSALVVSIVFLASYVYYHSQVGTTRFTAEGWVRLVYFIILGSHTVLAIVIVPLVIATLYFAFRENFQRHRRLARITLPTWICVSITGIVVYLMLYQWFPPASL